MREERPVVLRCRTSRLPFHDMPRRAITRKKWKVEVCVFSRELKKPRPGVFVASMQKEQKHFLQ